MDDAQMRNYNFKYRGERRVTDVLAFPFGKGTGEILISAESAKRQAKKYNHNLEEEILYLAIHGFLHLKGYRDDTQKEALKMKQKEEEIFDFLRHKK